MISYILGAIILLVLLPYIIQGLFILGAMGFGGILAIFTLINEFKFRRGGGK